MFGKGGMGNMMKQAQQMQERMQKVQEEIASMEVTGEAGAGMVKVTMTGSHSIRRVDIDDSLMEDDKDMLEDLIAAAFNDAARRVEEQQKEKMDRCDRRYAVATGHENAVLIDAHQPVTGTTDGLAALFTWGWPQICAAYGLSSFAT